MIQTGGARRRRRSTSTFPCVQSDMMMITAGGEECRLSSVTLCQFEAEHIAVEGQRAIQVGDLQMNVSNADLRVKRTKLSIRFHFDLSWAPQRATFVGARRGLPR